MSNPGFKGSMACEEAPVSLSPIRVISNSLKDQDSQSVLPLLDLPTDILLLIMELLGDVDLVSVAKATYVIHKLCRQRVQAILRAAIRVAKKAERQLLRGTGSVEFFRSLLDCPLAHFWVHEVDCEKWPPLWPQTHHCLEYLQGRSTGLDAPADLTTTADSYWYVDTDKEVQIADQDLDYAGLMLLRFVNLERLDINITKYGSSTRLIKIFERVAAVHQSIQPDGRAPCYRKGCSRQHHYDMLPFHKLTKIRLGGGIHLKAQCGHWLQALSGLPNLRKLEITSGCVVDNAEFLRRLDFNNIDELCYHEDCSIRGNEVQFILRITRRMPKLRFLFCTLFDASNAPLSLIRQLGKEKGHILETFKLWQWRHAHKLPLASESLFKDFTRLVIVGTSLSSFIRSNSTGNFQTVRLIDQIPSTVVTLLISIPDDVEQNIIQTDLSRRARTRPLNLVHATEDVMAGFESLQKDHLPYLKEMKITHLSSVQHQQITQADAKLISLFRGLRERLGLQFGFVGFDRWNPL